MGADAGQPRGRLDAALALIEHGEPDGLAFNVLSEVAVADLLRAPGADGERAGRPASWRRAAACGAVGAVRTRAAGALANELPAGRCGRSEYLWV